MMKRNRPLHFCGEQPPDDFVDNGPSIPVLNKCFPKWCRKRWGKSARIHDWAYHKIRVMEQFADYLERRGGYKAEVAAIRFNIASLRKAADAIFRINIREETGRFFMSRLFYRCVRMCGGSAIESVADPANDKYYSAQWDSLEIKYTRSI